MSRRPTRASFEIDAILRRIAHRQLGLVTIGDAAREGINRSVLYSRRDRGALVDVYTGVFRFEVVAASPEQKMLAASLAVPGSTIGAESAAIIQHMPVPNAFAHYEPAVFVGKDRSARTVGVRVVRVSHELPSRPWFTGRLASPAATLIQLSRSTERVVVERCLDYCLAERLVSTGAVRSLIERLPAAAVPGRRDLLALLGERAGGVRHRSGLEHRVGRWLNDFGLSGWLPNYRAHVAGGETVEVDFAWLSSMTVLEISPFYTHGTKHQQERDIERRRLLVEAGWRIVEAADPELAGRRAFARVADSIRGLRSRALSRSQTRLTHEIA